MAFADASLRHGTRVVLLRLNYSVELRYGVLLDIAQAWRGDPIELAMGHVNVIWQGDATAYAIRAIALAQSRVSISADCCRGVAGLDPATRFGELLGRQPVFS